MVFNVAPLLCPFTTASDIFMMRKDIAKQHYNNVGLNVPDNASLAIYQVALARHWLVMGLKTDSSFVDMRLSKMEAAIENTVSLVTASNLAINQLMEHEVTTTLITNVAFTKEPKWTTMMAKNMR